MKLKNFYIPEDIENNLKYAVKILGISEAQFIRGLLQKELRRIYPNRLSQKSHSGESKYPEAIRNYIYKRNKYHCAICKKKMGFWKTRFGGVNGKRFSKCKDLQIHHIDQNSQNNHTSNLILLCLSCHYQANRQKNYLSEKLLGKKEKF